MSLRVENIYKTYDKKSVLNGVSLYADDNRIVGLLGPNGAGKSTLMKIITGYVTPDSGQVEVCGEKIDSNAIDYKKNIGYLPEHNPLYLDMYVKEYLTHIAELYGIKDTQRAVAEVVEKTGLTPEKHKIIRQLSKGYRQRVGLAQAIIHNPKVLILDEPTTGLDPDYRDTATYSRLRQTTYGAVFDTYIARGRSNLPKSRTDRQRKYYIRT